MALRFSSHALHGFWGPLQCSKAQSCILSFKPNRLHLNTRPKSLCAMNMTAGQSGDPWKINLNLIMDKARKIWESSPQQVKTFPWNRALENFIQLIFDLCLAVIKYLCVPVLAVSSLSELSYCAHEKKLFLIPIPLLLGVAVAGVLRETAVELSPLLKDAEVPWHLIAMAIFFTILKLPGPYYPYWGRIFIPHFANGGLLRTLYYAFLWLRRPEKPSNAHPLQSSTV
ncbi:hypothetical protein U1Q18_003929 [Sarracenia purpurea var. burkii]